MEAFCLVVCQDGRASSSTGLVSVDYHILSLLIQRHFTDGCLTLRGFLMSCPLNVRHTWNICMGGAALMKCLKSPYTVTCDYMHIKGVCNVKAFLLSGLTP